MPTILVITASTRPIRRGNKVSAWLKTIADTYTGLDFVYADLADINLPFLDEPNANGSGAYQRDHTKRWSQIVAPADGFIFVTPEYNHGYPATLKNAMDYLFDEWQYKPVAFAGYGYNGALRSIEQLRSVVVAFHMAALNPQVNIRISDDFDQTNELVASDKLHASAVKMLDELKWWTEALRAARQKDGKTAEDKGGV